MMIPKPRRWMKTVTNRMTRDSAEIGGGSWDVSGTAGV
jgi:hypothetical protein